MTDQRIMVAFKDSGGIVRAWSTSTVQRQALRIAEEQLAEYKQGDSYNAAMEPFTREITKVDP